MKKFLFTGIFLIIAFLITEMVFFAPKNQPTLSPAVPTPTPVGKPATVFSAIDYSKVFTDPTIAQSVKETLQAPLNASEEAGFTVVSFPTDTQQRPNQVYTKNGIAEYVMQEITTDNSDFATFLNAHPQSESFQLFDTTHAGAGFSWYVFPKEGMAFFANKDAGFALKILYFPPETKNTFLSSTAKTFNLLQTDPSETVEKFE